VGARVVRLLVEFVPRTSSTPVATWCWQTEGRSVERVILGVRPSGFILSEFQSPSRRFFIGSHSLPPPLFGHLIGPSKIRQDKYGKIKTDEEQNYRADKAFGYKLFVIIIHPSVLRLHWRHLISSY
jgi:hypothetical protein